MCLGKFVSGRPKTVGEEIAERNPWYVDNQNPEAPHHRRVIENRNRIIIGVVRDQKERQRVANEHSWWKEVTLHVLDAGCGDGHLLRELTRIGGLTCFGFDYNPVRIENAKRAAPRANLSQKDLTKLGDLTPAFFDIVILSQVLEHVTEDEMALLGLARLLRLGGIMVVGVPNEGCWMGRIRNNVFERSIGKTTDHVHFYREREMRRKLENAGLKITRVEYEGIMLPRQELGNWLVSREWGFRLCQWLGSHVKSQCAGYYFVCEKAQ